MHRIFWVGFLVAGFCLAEQPPSSAPTPTPTPNPTPNTITCEGAGDVRIIKTEPNGEGGCTVLYTKDGKTGPVASAQHETKYCEGVVEKMQATLEGAAFKCSP